MQFFIYIRWYCTPIKLELELIGGLHNYMQGVSRNSTNCKKYADIYGKFFLSNPITPLNFYFYLEIGKVAVFRGIVWFLKLQGVFFHMQTKAKLKITTNCSLRFFFVQKLSIQTALV